MKKIVFNFLFLLPTFFFASTAVAQKHGQARLDSLVAESTKMKEDSNGVMLAHALSKAYNEVNPAAQLLWASKEIAIGEKMHWKKAIASGSLEVGNYQLTTGNYPNAIDYFLKALGLFEGLNETANINIVYINLCLTYQRLFRYEKAEEYGLKALASLEKKDPGNLLTILLLNLGNVYELRGKHDEAIVYFTRGLKLAQATGNKSLISNYTINLAAVMANTGHYAQALPYLYQALGVARESGSIQGTAYVLGNIGGVYVLMESDTTAVLPDSLRLPGKHAILQKAMPFLQESIDLCRNNNFKNPLPNYYQDQAKCYAMLGNYEGAYHAIRYYSDIKDTLLNLENKQTIKNLEDKRTIELGEKQLKITGLELSAQKERAAAAAVQQQQQLKLRQSALDLSNQQLSLTQKEKQIQSLDFEQQQGEYTRVQRDKDNRLKLAAQQAQIQQLEIQNSHRARIAFIAGLLLLAVVAGIVLRQSRLRKKANDELAILNARLDANNTQLTTTNRQLDEANRIKARFFGILSHDLRAPIGNLATFLRLQKEAPELLGKEERAIYQQQLATNADNLLSVMEDLLLWSKGQMNNFKPQIRSIHILTLFHDIQKLIPQGIATEVAFENPDNIDVATDENFLKTIMRNLTGNALKALAHTPDGKITWKAWAANGNKYLSISDNGPGLSKAQLETLFAESAVTSAGSGLGLHIIKDFTQMLGQQIEVKSEQGKGTTFIITMAA